MTIICLEGASAVGKSTTCQYLADHCGFSRIPEVNELFERPVTPASNWYLCRQVERWQMAETVSAAGGQAVLDGDPFQPLWYNWIFNELDLQPVEDVIEFYRSAIQAEDIRFPDRYFLLTAPEEVLRVRTQNDKSRSRRNFDMHLRLIRPQINYFKQMNLIERGRVKQLIADERTVLGDIILSYLPEPSGDVILGVFFEALCHFISHGDR